MGQPLNRASNLNGSSARCVYVLRLFFSRLSILLVRSRARESSILVLVAQLLCLLIETASQVSWLWKLNHAVQPVGQPVSICVYLAHFAGPFPMYGGCVLPDRSWFADQQRVPVIQLVSVGGPTDRFGR